MKWLTPDPDKFNKTMYLPSSSRKLNSWDATKTQKKNHHQQIHVSL